MFEVISMLTFQRPIPRYVSGPACDVLLSLLHLYQFKCMQYACTREGCHCTRPFPVAWPRVLLIPATVLCALFLEHETAREPAARFYWARIWSRYAHLPDTFLLISDFSDPVFPGRIWSNRNKMCTKHASQKCNQIKPTAKCKFILKAN